MKVTVYHNESLFARNNDEKKVFTRVAVVEAPMDDVMEALEYAYRWTNNIQGSWSIKEFTLEADNGVTMQNGDYNENVTVMADLPVYEGKTFGMRSTSMGDQMLMGTTKYKVAIVGFEEIV